MRGLYLHGRFGMRARQTGRTLLPFALSLSLGNLLSGKLHGRVRPVRLMANGLAMAALAAPSIAMALTLRAPSPLPCLSLAPFGPGPPPSAAPLLPPAPS